MAAIKRNNIFYLLLLRINRPENMRETLIIGTLVGDHNNMVRLWQKIYLTADFRG